MHFNVLILGLLRPEAEVGRYVAAGALAAALAMVPQSVEAVTLSHLAEFHAQGRRDDLQRLLTRTIWLSLGLVTPLALVVLSFGARLLGVNPKAS